MTSSNNFSNFQGDGDNMLDPFTLSRSPIFPTIGNSPSLGPITPESGDLSSTVGIKTRHRSGTLPSRITTQPSPSTLFGATSPALNAVLEDAASLNSHQITPQHNRLRSSSIQSSIWSDGNNDSSVSVSVPRLTINDNSSLESFAGCRTRSQSTTNVMNNGIKQAPFYHLPNPVIEEEPTFALLNEELNGLSINQPSFAMTPILVDRLPQDAISFVSTFQDASLGPTNTLILLNLPQNGSVTSFNFYKMLCKFGTVQSVRIIHCHNNDLIAIAEFDGVESAMTCKALLNHQELFPGLNCIVSFARIISIKSGVTPQTANKVPGQQPPIQTSVNVPNQFNQGPAPHQSQHVAPPPRPPPRASALDDFNTSNEPLRKKVDLLYSTVELYRNSLTPEESFALNHLILGALKYHEVKENNFGRLPDPLPVRDFDSPKLREIRKEIDNNHYNQTQVEELSLAMLSELPELASDYLGNTIVQKLFEISSPLVRDIMLRKLSPYISQMGVHKNGTWAAQKLISTATTKREMDIIVRSLKPYTTSLFNDQYGNYVLQCCLKFNSPWNDFIFESILSDFLEISRGRYGARAIRTILESDLVTLPQVLSVTSRIIMDVLNLAINSNGSLLITWFLDTCQLPNRHINLTNNLLPHLFQLCVHKLGNLTVLKLLNFRGDLLSRNLILGEIFGRLPFHDTMAPEPPSLLKGILSDSNVGPNFIFKLITTVHMDSDLKNYIVNKIKQALMELQLPSTNGYKKLFEEVGFHTEKQTKPKRKYHDSNDFREHDAYVLNPQTHPAPGVNPVYMAIDQFTNGYPYQLGYQEQRLSQQNLPYSSGNSY
ncbi:RNA-binding proteins [Komagataella phaffii CBS 7435]|uniref:RNA-binding proteins n=1 Tax=Komagataella phaffii (strain ATCC 76273 / CBS 7435 / CECT 11047 / NRRL Y-11430 / Wegner 21-1) TaxID=981350 RepID=F2QY88_KOMPC|nr:RNA-binding protein [Komagataella phaffii CBS 7435]CCA40366.1 RNA-binding proteins [Komagataella phaffii CBS 7435]